MPPDCPRSLDHSQAPVTGVIFCGGASQRMGRSKALLEYQGQSFLERSIALLSGEYTLPLPGLRIVLSTRADIAEGFAETAPELPRIFDDDAAGIPGPLGALLSVHRARPEHDLLIVAVDMPLLKRATVERVLAKLCEGSAGTPAPGGYCYAIDNRIEPLCAAYRAGALAKFAAASDCLQRYSMQQLGDRLQLERLAPDACDRAGLRSVNTPEDLAALGE